LQVILIPPPTTVVILPLFPFVALLLDAFTAAPPEPRVMTTEAPLAKYAVLSALPPAPPPEAAELEGALKKVPTPPLPPAPTTSI
jgi:hypothetical protein